MVTSETTSTDGTSSNGDTSIDVSTGGFGDILREPIAMAFLGGLIIALVLGWVVF